jgi:hypothetical protein
MPILNSREKALVFFFQSTTSAKSPISEHSCLIEALFKQSTLQRSNFKPSDSLSEGCHRLEEIILKTLESEIQCI